jgi:hypothetical protein
MLVEEGDLQWRRCRLERNSLAFRQIWALGPKRIGANVLIAAPPVRAGLVYEGCHPALFTSFISTEDVKAQASLHALAAMPSSRSPSILRLQISKRIRMCMEEDSVLPFVQ